MRPGVGHVAALVAAAALLWAIGGQGTAGLRSGERSPREFMAFYTVGHVLNASPSELYRPEAFLRTYHSLFPSVPVDKTPVYLHAPFEGLVFQPFARLAYEQALVAWQIFSLGLICA